MKPEDVKTITQLLSDEFDAEVESENVDEKRGRYRFGLISKQFNGVNHLKRQDRIWEVLDKAVDENKLSREAILEISLIIAYAPDELHQQA